MFAGCDRFNRDISNWDVSNVKNIKNMFNNISGFNQDISNWNISKVSTNNLGNYGANSDHPDPLFRASSIYYFQIYRQELTSSNIQTAVDVWYNNGNEVNEINAHGGAIYNWDVSKVTDMSNLFAYKTNFNTDISSWNVSNVTNMKGMFLNCMKLNVPFDSWNVSKVTSIRTMFYGTGMNAQHWPAGETVTMFNSPLNSWNVSNVVDMKNVFMYNNGFNQPLNNWNVSKVTDISEMFAANGGVFNQDISNWNVSSVHTWYNFGQNQFNHYSGRFRASELEYFN